MPKTTWLERHAGHDWSYNEEGVQTYTLLSYEEGVATVEADSAEGTVMKAHFFCETCYDSDDALGPGPSGGIRYE